MGFTPPSAPANSHVSLCTKVCNFSPINCSKTVLVHLSHRDNPFILHKANAILDEHSNCTLIDQKVTDILNVDSVAH